MRTSAHAAVSAAAAAGLWAVSGSWQAALWSCASGWLLDADHLADYLLAPRPKRSAADFLAFWRTFREPRLFLWLHAWEAVPLLACAAWLGWAPAATGGLALGWCHHLLLDQLGNPVYPSGYFLSRRLAVGFASGRVLRDRPSRPAASSRRP